MSKPSDSISHRDPSAVTTINRALELTAQNAERLRAIIAGLTEPSDRMREMAREFASTTAKMHETLAASGVAGQFEEMQRRMREQTEPLRRITEAIEAQQAAIFAPSRAIVAQLNQSHRDLALRIREAFPTGDAIAPAVARLREVSAPLPRPVVATRKPEPEHRRFIVARDNAPALEFDGVVLSSVEEGPRGEEPTLGTVAVTRAAVYQTKGGKFIAEFCRHAIRPNSKTAGMPKLFSKAAVFATIDEATNWFRPGRLTNRLLAALGIKRTEFIE